MKTLYESATVKVVETIDADGDVQRQLFLGPPFTNIQGSIKVNRPRFHTLDFTKKLTFGALCIGGSVENALFLGLGAGVTVQAVRDIAPLAMVDIVDIDLGLFEPSHKYFFDLESERIELYHEDAFAFLKRSTKRYDFICSDIFGASLDVPDYLLSGEFAQAAKHCLSAKGILAINTHRHLHKSMIESLSHGFEFVFSLPGNNCLLLCTDSAPRFGMPSAVVEQQLANNIDVRAILAAMTVTRRVDASEHPQA